MEWSLKDTISAVCSLLDAPTYSALQEEEESLKLKGISIENDFILTDNRREALDKIKGWFNQAEKPTAILTGWFGSGKTAVLRHLYDELLQEKICYGYLKADPIEIRLNEQDTLAKFIQKLLDAISQLKDEGWIVEVYQKNQRLIDLPPLEEDTLEGIRIAILGMDISLMSQVVQFLEGLFQEYKKSTGDQRVIALIIDELENITFIAEQEKTEEKNKLSHLLRVLLNKSVREYLTKDPSKNFVLLIFSIPERQDLLEGKWIRADTAERCQPVECNINLTPETAIALMKSMLRLYFLQVVGVADKNAKDPKLEDWLKQLNSADNVEDDLFTYPIKPDIHTHICYRVLRRTPAGSVRSFRAYQVALLTLLKEWEGTRVIDMRFAISKVSQLRHEVSKYHTDVDVTKLIGEEQISNLIDVKFPQLAVGPKYALSMSTLAGITQRVTPIVEFRRDDLSTILDKNDMPSETIFAKMCEEIQRRNVPGWSATANVLELEVAKILSLLTETEEVVPPEQRLKALLDSTSTTRQTNVPTQIIARRFHESAVTIDEHKILHIKDRTARGPLIEEYLIGFDIERAIMESKVGSKKGCSIGVLFTEQSTTNIDDIPFKVSIVFPPQFQEYESRYAERVCNALTMEERWQQKFQPLMRAIMKFEPDSSYNYFKEAVKIILLLPDLTVEERKTFADHSLNIHKIILDAADLDNSQREEWIREKLRFREFHDIDPTRRLIKVLSALEGQETLLYPNSDDLQPTLHKSFDVTLLSAVKWKSELLTEWHYEEFISDDGRLRPFGGWSTERQRLYGFIDDSLKGKSLSFNDIGELIFGECKLHPKAEVALHLFLKLGRVHPLGWNLSDDSNPYSSMKVVPGELLKDKYLSQARGKADDLMYHLVMQCYLYSPDERKEPCSKLKAVLEQRVKLTEDASLSTIEKIAKELADYDAPTLSKVRLNITPEMTSRLPEEIGKFGEFVTKLNDISQKGKWIAIALTPAVSELFNSLQEDLKCEVLFQAIDALYKNWGKECPEVPKPDRVLVQISKEYSNEIAKTPQWVEKLMRETDETFEAKVLHIGEEKLEEEVESVCNWIHSEVCTIIKPAWKPTYASEDVQRLNTALKSYEEDAKHEISAKAKDLEKALGEIRESKGIPAFSQRRQDLTNHESRLQQDLNVLHQYSNSLLNNRFGPVITSSHTHIDEWEEFRTGMLKAQEERIDLWLQKNRLEDHRKQILQAMNNVNMSISDLDKKLREQGIDPLNLLRETQATPILAMFAAAQLLENLVKEANH